MKILMVSDVYLPRINGVSTSILTFRREFLKRGHGVSVIAPEYGPVTDDETSIFRVPSRYVFVDPEDRMMKMKSVLALVPYLASRKFDILHIHTPFVAHYAGVLLSQKLKIPRIETYHTYFEEYLFHYVRFLPRDFLRLIAVKFSRYQCNHLDALVVPSRAMLDVLRDYGVTTKAAVIPTGIDLEKFNEGEGEAFRRKYGIERNRPTLVYVGRVAFEKNIDFLVRVVGEVKKIIPDILFVIAGEGPAERSLKKGVEQLNLRENVLSVGYLSRLQDLLDCYRAGDAFVFASHTETQGLVLLEAMALGVPVVSTAAMGTKDILNARRGALISEYDLQDFTAKVVEVLQNKDLRSRLGAEGKEYAGQWSAGAMAEKMIDFYGNVASRNLSPML